MSTNNIVWVVGSLNVDLVQRVARLPGVGETLSGADLQIHPGGKGANQACAAARLGGRVRMVGNVGRDPFGDFLVGALQQDGVEMQCVHRVEAATGSATILVFDDGDNSIVVSPGANAALTPRDVDVRLNGIREGDLLLCQLETPIETVDRALEIAKRAGATTILDPAPAVALPGVLLSRVDVLTPNESEAAALLDGSGSRSSDARVISAELRRPGPAAVILKMGAEGCFVDTGEWQEHLEAQAVSAVDTTAAGDTFNGALAARLAAGQRLSDAARFAGVAATLSVTRAGAQSSVPTLEGVAEFMRERGIGLG